MSQCDKALLFMPIVWSNSRRCPVKAINFRKINTVFLSINETFLLVPFIAHTFIVAAIGERGNLCVDRTLVSYF